MKWNCFDVFVYKKVDGTFEFEDQIYSIGDQELEVIFDPIILIPDLDETVAFVYSVSLTDGSSLPDGITIDNTSFRVRIDITDQSLGGVYNVTVSATGSVGSVKGLVFNSTFELIVESTNSTLVTANPYFE